MNNIRREPPLSPTECGARRTIARRQVVRGAAWAAPAIAVGAAAPMAAATVPCLPGTAGSTTVNYTNGQAVEVIIPAGCSTISYTVVGGDGAGNFAGRAAVLTGTLFVPSMNSALTLNVIAGGGGTMTQNGSGAGGLGYGNGGSADSTADGTSWRGGGGAGSAILLGSAAVSGAGNTPLVVAGGSGGSAGILFNGVSFGGGDNSFIETTASFAGDGGTLNGDTGDDITVTWHANYPTTNKRIYRVVQRGGRGAVGSTGGAAAPATATWALIAGSLPTPAPYFFQTTGVAGGDHGAGSYGGGNGGNAPAVVTTPQTPPNSLQHSGGGGGGYAGGGGGSSTLLVDAFNASGIKEFYVTTGMGGGGGSSYAASGSVANAAGTVVVSNSGATVRADARGGSATNYSNNGYVTLTWS